MSLSIPQLYYLQTQLFHILKLENGDSKDSKGTNTPKNDAEENTFVLGATFEHMKKMTGRTSFTLSEMINPGETIKYYNDLDKQTH